MLLMSLFQAVDEGTMPLTHACERSAVLGADHAVEPADLEELSEAAFQYSSESWQRAWSLSRIVYAAASAGWSPGEESQPPGHARADALGKAAADLVSVAQVALSEAGDVRFFNLARVAAERGIAAADALGYEAAKGIILQRRGSMILDCYTAGRSAANYQAEFQHWVDKALSGGDPELIRAASKPVNGSGDKPAEPWWPEPLAAMDLAEADLRAALLIVRPYRRGRVLKALAQTLQWREIFGGPVARAELAEICQKALAALSPEDTEARVALSQIMQATTGPEAADAAGAGSRPAPADDPDISRLIDVLENDPAQYLAGTKPITAWEAVSYAAGSLAERAPARALRLLSLHQQIPGLWAREDLRAQHFAAVLLLLARAHAPVAVMRVWESADAFDEVAAGALTHPGPGPAPALAGLSEDQATATLTMIMLASTKFSRERVGLLAAELVERDYGGVWSAHKDAYTDVVATLHQGEAINLEGQGDNDGTVAMFLQAASQYATISSPDRAVTSIDNAADLVDQGELGDLAMVSAWCTAEGLRMEVAAPQAGPRAMQRLIGLTLAHQVRNGTSAEDVLLLLQAAKGRRFAATLAQGTAGWVPDTQTRRLLAEEARAEERLPADQTLLAPPSWQAALDEDVLISAYASEYEQSPSDTSEGEVVNYQRAIERRIVAALAPADYSAGRPHPIADIRAALDPRTALLMLYEGPHADGRLATYSLLLTDEREYGSAGAGTMPYAIVEASAEGRQIQLPPAGFYAASVRRAIKEEPAPRDVSRKGEELLEDLAARYTGLVSGHHAELKAAGKDRLLVVPHGATHFLPLHLAGPSSQPLAGSLTVTYLANLAQLTSARPAPVRRRASAAVFALGYADQPRLPRLESSAAEARAIAQILEVEPVMDTSATETAFADALQTCRYVHLRAHGRHNVDAPLFQTVFLAPGGGDDGRLRAHEILALDLRGLEVVTLGACETALGRIDQSDNLRGMPAALLLAGAGAVIGTLWEVSAQASTTFFTAFYKILISGTDDVIGTFGKAQEQTRERHSEYRDWGAFYLTGGYAASGKATP
jgi:CHAT domain-containing protein